jgi:hypothetical protein
MGSVTPNITNIPALCRSMGKKTAYTPEYGVIGSETRMAKGVRYIRYFTLRGVDAKESKEELWSTKVKSLGNSGDLRAMFPIMLIASERHIGENTGKQFSYSIKDDKQLAQRIEGMRQW